MKNFNELPTSRHIHETECSYVVKDGFPVSPGRCLIISKSLKETFWGLSEEEKMELLDLIEFVYLGSSR